MENNWINQKFLKSTGLIVGEILLLVLPPLSAFSNPVIILAILPGLFVGFFHARAKSRKGQPNARKIEKAARWLGIVFALLFGVSILITKGTSYLFEVGFYYALWQAASFYYGLIWVPYLIGLNTGLKEKS